MLLKSSLKIFMGIRLLTGISESTLVLSLGTLIPSLVFLTGNSLFHTLETFMNQSLSNYPVNHARK